MSEVWADLPIYETYKGINIYVWEDVGGSQSKGVGVQFDWYGRLQNAQEEEYETPTLENKLQAARSAIDLLLALKDKGLVDDEGILKGGPR